MKKILQLVLLFSTLHTAFSQTPTDYYNRMDHVFGAIGKSKVSTSLLKEFGVSFSDLAIHNGALTTENHVDATRWSSLYQSLYTMQVGTSLNMSSPETISNLWTSTQAANPDKIILSAMHFRYQQYKSNAYSNGDVNVVNERIYDVAGRNPYETKQLVAFAPQDLEFTGSSFVFRLPSNLFFNQSGKTLQSISIDFGNGQGYQTILTNTDKTVVYGSGGEKMLKIRIRYTDNSNWYSQSKVWINYIPSGASGRYDGIDIDTTTIVATKLYQGVAGSAHITVEYAGNDGVLDKPLIVVEGFDFTDDFTYEDFYDDVDLGGIDIPLNGSTLNEEIEAEGYDIVFVDYDNGTDFIQRNAYMLESVIEWVNEQKQGVATAEPNVILGMSMGGLVARYALRDMELNGLDHDTKLYISHDVPHQGANVPVAYQAFVRHLAGEQIGIPVLFSTLTLNVLDLEDAIEGLTEGMDWLNSPAAQQMLIYQTDGIGDNIVHSNNKAIRNTFLSEYQSMGMPQANGIRNIAISNGAECGTKLSYPDNTVIAEMDSTIDINFLVANIGLTLLNWASLNPLKALSSFASFNTDIKIQFKMRALPNQQVKELYRGRIYIKKKVLGFINVEEPLINEVNFNSTSNMLALDNAAGGIFNVDVLFDVPEEFGDLIKEPEFCFIPTYSSLDLGSGSQQIVSSDLTRVLSPIAPPTGAKNIPFDNFITNPSASEDHTQFIPENGQWLLTELQGTNAFYSCASECVTPIPLSISGPSLVCTTNSTFTLSNPGGGTVSWSKSSNLTLVSSNSTSAIVRASSSRVSGNGWVRATITSDCGSVDIQEDFWVGKPGYIQTNPTGVPAIEASISSYVTITATSTPAADAGSLTWWTNNPSALSLSTGGNICIVECLTTGYNYVYVTTSNQCGISLTRQIPINVVGSGGGGVCCPFPQLVISPNPIQGQDELSIDIINFSEIEDYYGEQDTSYKIELFSMDNELKYTSSLNKNGVKVNLKHLGTGLYLINIIGRDFKETHRIIIE